MAEAWVPVEVGEVLAQTNNGQGDCLFLSISEQLDGQVAPAELRQMAVQYLTQRREDFFVELLSLGWNMQETGEIEPIPLEDDILIDAVLQVLANPVTWGGAECIAALGLSLNREVRVYQENGPTFEFPGGDNAEAPIRILLRYPRGGQERRTHYESVLAWRPERPASSSVQVRASTSTSSTQTEAGSIHEDRDASNQSSEVCSPVRSEGSSMVLRPRSSLPFSQSSIKREDFSDEEELSEEVRNCPELIKFTLCLMCTKNVGRYVLVPCGAFPVCGRCIRTWYVRIKDAPCPCHGRPVIGWAKVFNQN